MLSIATESVEEITRIVRDADQDFEGSGGSTRHWVRDCFLPALEKSGLRIVGAPAPASAQVCAVPGCAYLASMGDGCHKHPFASAQGEVCESCGERDARTFTPDDVYLCAECAKQNAIDEEWMNAPMGSKPTPPSSEKTGEERK